MKTKLKYVIIASLIFGAIGFNSAKAITADELLANIVVPVYQFVIGTFATIGQVLVDHDARISDNEAKVTALENAGVATDARLAALEAGPGANIAATPPTAFDDINAGFTEGTTWVNTLTQQAYILVDSTPGSAIWKLITPIYEVGQRGPAGGIVFISYSGGQEGYEAAPVDQGTADWGCNGVDIPGADRTDIDAGSANTADILAGCATPDIAARLADNYSLNGFNDWVLPSIDQLNELYLHRDLVGGFVEGPVDASYWSSSEFNSDEAWGKYFFNGATNRFFKTNLFNVRAIRSF